MSGKLTTTAARNIFYGSGVFFFLYFLGLTFDTHQRMPTQDNRANLTEAVSRGKLLWEKNNCIGCHSLLGEGAYFAPELGNVYKRRGGDFIKRWMQMQPTNVPGRRQMPNFHLNDQQLDDLVEFLKYSSEIDTKGWPPNIEG